MTDSVIRSRIDGDVKEQAAQLFGQMGLTMSDAIRLFLYQSVAEQRLPFSVNIPNAKTAATLTEIKKHPKRLKKTSLEQLEKDWNDART